MELRPVSVRMADVVPMADVPDVVAKGLIDAAASGPQITLHLSARQAVAVARSLESDARVAESIDEARRIEARVLQVHGQARNTRLETLAYGLAFVIIALSGAMGWL